MHEYNPVCVCLPASELQSILEPFLLRRVKSEVALDLPKKTELVVYHGMSALQKKYYKAALMRDYGESPCSEPWPKQTQNQPKYLLVNLSDAFGNEQGGKNRLLNILMNLRKCVDHPYLFDGEIMRSEMQLGSRWTSLLCLKDFVPPSCLGVEPEPFQIGEHIIEASGKLCLLDSILAFLHKG